MTMGIPMRLAVFFTLVPSVALAVARGPLLSAMVQITTVLPAGASGVLESLPLEPNTSLVVMATGAWFLGALALKRPHLWLGVGTAGPLAFGYFPFGLVRWQGKGLEQVFGLDSAPRLGDWAWAALPVIVLTSLLLADRIILDAQTLRERGLAEDQVRRTALAAGVDVAARLALAAALGLGAAYALMQADTLPGTGRSVTLTMLLAGALAVVGVLVMVRGQPPPEAEDDGPRVFAAADEA